MENNEGGYNMKHHRTSDYNTSSAYVEKACRDVLSQFVPIIFAVFINLLDACTFGTVFFPSQLGSGVSGLAIELFLLSTVVVQLALIRMSSFECGLGTSMAENIPFVHTMAISIFNTLEHTHTIEQMMPTVLITVCLSTIINGMLFFLVGYFKMGNVLHFFPRHVIMGMTAGFGIFLLNTAIESTTGIIMSDQTFSSFFHALSSSRRFQLGIVCSFEILLRVVEYLKFRELAVPVLMVLLPIAFYFVLSASGTSFQIARENDWLFPITPSANWWDTWELFDFYKVEWSVVFSQWPTIFSLGFFTLILVPIRIPSLSIITGDDVDFDDELKAQGVANILSACVGAVHNYLSYSNSIFYYMVGGKGKTSQMAVTLLTLVLFFVGPQIINYIPRLIAGVIMLHLGVDLIIGTLLTSRKTLDSLEYSSVIFIAAVVSVSGFVPGIFMGVVSACMTFVVQSSRQSSIRAVFSGDTARSNTNWSVRQRDKLNFGLLEVNSIFVVQLQGHLFFGNVQQVVGNIESALKLNLSSTEDRERSYKDKEKVDTVVADTSNPSSSSSLLQAPIPLSYQIRYLILDCSFVTGADANAITGLLKMIDHIAAEHNNNSSDNRNYNHNKSMGSGSSINSSYSGISINNNNNTNSREVQVHVIFAGLESNLEAMFSVQEEAMIEQQSLKLSKERRKEGIVEGEIRNGNGQFDDFLEQGRGGEIGSSRTGGVEQYGSYNHGTDFTPDKEDKSGQIQKNNYKTLQIQIGHKNTNNILNALDSTLNGSNDSSGYDSMDSFESYSSISPRKNDYNAVISELTINKNEKDNNEDYKGTEYKNGHVLSTAGGSGKKKISAKRGRSPSWGNTSLAMLDNNSRPGSAFSNQSNHSNNSSEGSNNINGSNSRNSSNSNLHAIYNLSKPSKAKINDITNHSHKSEIRSSPPLPVTAPIPLRSNLQRVLDLEALIGSEVSGEVISSIVDEKTRLVNSSKFKVVPHKNPEKLLQYISPPLSSTITSVLPADIPVRQSEGTINIMNPSRRTSRTNAHTHGHNKILSRRFYSDVNTALQAVEERIIKSTRMPKVRVSCFHARKPQDGTNAMSRSQSAELTRQDIVYSPEPSSSLDGFWSQQVSSSPTNRRLSPTSPSMSRSNLVKIVSPCQRAHGTSSSSELDFDRRLSAIEESSSFKSTSNNTTNNTNNNTSSVMAIMDADGSRRTEVHKANKPLSHSSDSTFSLSPATTYDSNTNLVRLDHGSGQEMGLGSVSTEGQKAYPRRIPPPISTDVADDPSARSPLRYVHSSPLSPDSRQLKIKLTNMLFDLSSQWTVADSPALKRLSRQLRKGVVVVSKKEILWEAGTTAFSMGILISGRLKAVLRSNDHANIDTTRTLQVILPGTLFGELGLLSRGTHSRTIIASADSQLAMFTRDTLDDIEENDKALLCVLQFLALRTAAARSHELMLFNAGSLGP